MPNTDLLLDIGSVVRFKENQVVFVENDVGDNMYIALQGVFGVYASSCTGFSVRVAEIKPGSFFGEMSVIDDWPRSATVEAEEDSAALVISKDKLHMTFEKCPDIADMILNMLQIRADKTSEAVRISGKSVPALPKQPQGLNTTDDKMAAMAALSRQIRLMNKLLLYKKTGISTGKDGKESSGQIRLLPEGYKPINKADSNDNYDSLQRTALYCPNCFTQQDFYIPSQSIVPQRKHSPDGRVIYKNFNILLYSNIVCSFCNYTDSYQDFTTSLPDDAKLSNDEIRFPNEEGFNGFAETHTHTADEAVLSLYQQIYCLKAVTDDALRFAKAWIRLYWLFSDYRYKDLALSSAAEAEYFYSKYLRDNKNHMEDYNVAAMKNVLAELGKATRTM